MYTIIEGGPTSVERLKEKVSHEDEAAQRAQRGSREVTMLRKHHQDTARHQGVKTKGKELGTRSRESRENPKRKVGPLSIRINGDRKIVHIRKGPVSSTSQRRKEKIKRTIVCTQG